MPRRSRNEQLKENYRRLREAGFTSAEATRYRGANPENITRAIQEKTLPRVSPVARAARTGEMVTERQKRDYRQYINQWRSREKPIIIGKVPEIQKGAIKYETLPQDGVYKYLSRYTYVVTYQVKNSDKTLEWKYLTLTSHTPKFKYELWDEMAQILLSTGGRYDSAVVAGSFGLVNAYYNP